VPARETPEVCAVRDFLTRPLARAVLPDVMQNREVAALGGGGNRIQQRIIGAPARRELHPDGAALGAAGDLLERVRGVVRVDGDVRPDALRVAILNGQHLVVA